MVSYRYIPTLTLLSIILLSCDADRTETQTWQNTFNLNTAVGIEEDQDGDFVVYSNREIIKLNDRGEQLWNVNLEDEQSEWTGLQIVAINVLPAGGYAVTGTGEASSGSGSKEVLLFFLDQAAGLDNLRSLYTCNEFCSVSIQETGEGYRFLITEGRDDALKILTAIVTDSSGSLVDQQSIELANSENVLLGRSMVLGENNGFVVDTYLRSSTGAEETTRKLIRMDAELNTIWEYDYGAPVFTEIQEIKELGTGGYILIGSYQNKGWMVKIDYSGNPEWDKKYGSEDPGKRFLFDVIQNSRGQIIATGSNNVNSEGYDDVWLLGVDRQGDQLWEVLHGSPYYDFGRSIINGSDNGYLVAGGTQTGFENPIQMWVLSLNGEGKY